MPIEVIHVSPREKQRLEEIEDEYNLRVRKREIRPVLIENMFFPFGYRRGLVLAREQGQIVGATLYEPDEAHDQEELSHLLQDYGGKRLVCDEGNPINRINPSQLRGFRTLPEKSRLVNLCMIESFKRGAGRLMMQQLQGVEGIDAIFLNPVDDAIPFYEAQGFQRSGICMDELRYPLMIWTKTGEY